MILSLVLTASKTVTRTSWVLEARGGKETSNRFSLTGSQCRVNRFKPFFDGRKVRTKSMGALKDWMNKNR